MRVSFFLEKMFYIFLFVGYSSDVTVNVVHRKATLIQLHKKHGVFLPVFVQVKSADFLKIKITPRHQDLLCGFL